MLLFKDRDIAVVENLRDIIRGLPELGEVYCYVWSTLVSKTKVYIFLFGLVLQTCVAEITSVLLSATPFGWVIQIEYYMILIKSNFLISKLLVQH